MKVTLEQIIVVGIHLGHPTRQWNPKMSSYTYGIQNGIHLIDLVKTMQQIEKAQAFVREVRKSGKGILFVGTKYQAAEVIEEVAYASQSFFVNKRWLGGILTNWVTVQASLFQLHRLESEKNTGMWDLLPKKEAILLQTRLCRLNRYLSGLKGIRARPGVVVVVGQSVELTAIQECYKLKIPVVCRLDTDCDPSIVEIGVPINDDSTSRIRLFLELIALRIQKGQRSLFSKDKNYLAI
jgi:small subunit ribosomal protein S2